MNVGISFGLAIKGGIDKTAGTVPQNADACRSLHETNPRAEPMQQRRRVGQLSPRCAPLLGRQFLDQGLAGATNPHGLGHPRPHTAGAGRKDLNKVPR